MIIYIYLYMQMGTIRGYSVHKPRNISRDYPPTHCWLKCPIQGKTSRSSVAAIETLENTNARCS